MCITHAPRSGPVLKGVTRDREGQLQACPLGLLVTRVVANGSLTAVDDGVLDMTFPFTEPWPVSLWRDFGGMQGHKHGSGECERPWA